MEPTPRPCMVGVLDLSHGPRCCDRLTVMLCPRCPKAGCMASMFPCCFAGLVVLTSSIQRVRDLRCWGGSLERWTARASLRQAMWW
jgi:hypothetical protein